MVLNIIFGTFSRTCPGACYGKCSHVVDVILR
jgi:hypothetical protein